MRWRRMRRRLLLFLTVMGPGIITASVDQDAGGITTYSVAGAQYGYSLLWSLPFIVLALAVIQEMGTRMGVVTGRGLADLIRERFGLRITLLCMAILVVANLANTASEFAGVAASFEIFHISRHWSVPLTALFVFGLVIQGTYRAVERIFLVASALYVVYVVSALLAQPPWGAILSQTVRPSFSLTGGYLTTLITIVGTTIAPWMQFYLQSSIVDKGIRLRDLRWARLDAYVGSLVAGLIAFFIIVACGATLFPNGVRVETAKDAALALEPFAGHYATILFAFGLLNASIFSAAILPLSTAYAVCEALGWETGVDRRPREAPGFFIIYTLMIVLGAAPILLPRAPLVAIMFWSQTLNGLLLPLVLLVMLTLINDPEIMGRHVNSVPFNLVAWGTAAVMIALSLLLLLTGLA
ncbi:MAG: Nramp family divalent metal transporter [candidate division NC10 bacterium]|nr:Nramp family divalent metal transporter [candidate division NC10 bacterium]MBI2163101.1 Nramp family divalent metal transporter [candidate division NC10 bacterium]MBI2457955.1 Nramp family divalent metal transporter [candidate division NC10 bacterium]